VHKSTVIINLEISLYTMTSKTKSRPSESSLSLEGKLPAGASGVSIAYSLNLWKGVVPTNGPLRKVTEIVNHIL